MPSRWKRSGIRTAKEQIGHVFFSLCVRLITVLPSSFSRDKISLNLIFFIFYSLGRVKKNLYRVSKGQGFSYNCLSQHAAYVHAVGKDAKSNEFRVPGVSVLFE